MFDYFNNLIYRLRLKRYIKRNLKKGFKLKEIKNKLYKKGLEKKYVKEIVDDILYKKTEKKIIIGFFLIFFSLYY